MPKSAPKNPKPFSDNCPNCPIASNCPLVMSQVFTPISSEAILNLDKGQEVFQAGAEFRHLYIIQTGSLKLYSISKQGDEQITSFHAAGEIIGFDGLASGTHMAFAQTLEPTTICCLNPAKLIKAPQPKESKLNTTIIALLSRELYAREEHIMVIAKLTAEQRVVDFILKQSERLQALHRNGNEIKLPMTRYEIGNYLALTVETVSRVFMLLKAKGYIQVAGRYVQIINHEALTKILATTSGTKRS